MEINISLLKDLGAAFRDLGDAVAKISDGIKHAVVSGVEGYDAVKARRAAARLVDVCARVSRLHVFCDITDRSLREYSRGLLSGSELDRARAWSDALLEVNRVLEHVAALTQDIDKERSDVVLEPVYRKLQDAFAARQRLLGELCLMPPPASPEELRAIDELCDRYESLIRQLTRASAELNAYVKTLKK